MSPFAAFAALVVALGAGGACTKPAPTFDREILREIILDQVYGFCPANKDVPISNLTRIDPKSIPADLPPDLDWCRREWLVYGEAGVWWAADIKRLTIDDVAVYESADSPKQAQVTITITLYVLTEPVEAGGPARVESRAVTRKIGFHADKLRGWRVHGFNRAINPQEW